MSLPSTEAATFCLILAHAVSAVASSSGQGSRELYRMTYSKHVCGLTSYHRKELRGKNVGLLVRMAVVANG
jgi:hypothetical protein